MKERRESRQEWAGRETKREERERESKTDAGVLSARSFALGTMIATLPESVLRVVSLPCFSLVAPFRVQDVSSCTSPATSICPPLLTLTVVPVDNGPPAGQTHQMQRPQLRQGRFAYLPPHGPKDGGMYPLGHHLFDSNPFRPRRRLFSFPPVSFFVVFSLACAKKAEIYATPSPKNIYRCPFHQTSTFSRFLLATGMSLMSSSPFDKNKKIMHDAPG